LVELSGSSGLKKLKKGVKNEKKTQKKTGFKQNNAGKPEH